MEKLGLIVDELYQILRHKQKIGTVWLPAYIYSSMGQLPLNSTSLNGCLFEIWSTNIQHVKNDGKTCQSQLIRLATLTVHKRCVHVQCTWWKYSCQCGEILFSSQQILIISARNLEYLQSRWRTQTTSTSTTATSTTWRHKKPRNEKAQVLPSSANITGGGANSGDCRGHQH